MGTTQLTSIACAIIILAIATIAVIIKMRNSKDLKDKVEKFLDSISTNIILVVKDIIENFDASDYSTLEEFETDVMSKIYETVFDTVKKEAEEAFKDDPLCEAIINKIDSTTIIKMVDKMFEVFNFKNDLKYNFGVASLKDVEEMDESLTEEFSHEDFNDEVNVEDLPLAEEVEHTDEEIAALNPQRDDEEEFNPEDDSMELIEGENIITDTDKNGNTLYYAVDQDGKKRRVSKEYAINQMM